MEMNYSVIITAKNEPKTVGRLVGQIECQLSKFSKKFEILLVCPDEKTKESAISCDKLQVVKWIKDKGKGKPAALNLAFNKAKGDILILTDGDVELGKAALGELVKEFCCRDKSRLVPTDNIGLATGRPVPVNPRNYLFGFWAHFLTYAAHRQRTFRATLKEYFDASGYLLAVKKDLVSPMPENILVDDAWLSRQIWKQGYKIGYAPGAEVRVKFPTNTSDWITQKKRTISGYIQLATVGVKQVVPVRQMRSFSQETKGLWLALTYPKNIKEYFWILLLIVCRLYVWLAVFIERKILKKPYSGNWKRIESTK
jgi:poly-beta-1,6-N-acetyl-D-glucosamine synthase